MLTLMPANFVPAGPEAAGDGLAAVVQAVRTRIGMIAAATSRYRDTACSPPLDIRRRSSSILNRRRYAGQYANRGNKVKISHAVQQAGRQKRKSAEGAGR